MAKTSADEHFLWVGQLNYPLSSAVFVRLIVVYMLVSYILVACHEVCESCVGGKPEDCKSCAPGYQKQNTESDTSICEGKR